MQDITNDTLAPLFKTLDIFNNPIHLENFRGKKILLSFFRNAACALCNLQIHDLIQRYPIYKAKGLEILAVFESSQENMLKYVGRQDVPFPLIADPEGVLYKLYNVENSEIKINHSMNLPKVQQRVSVAEEKGFSLIPEAESNFYRMPADFLINVEGRIIIAHYAYDLVDHLSQDEIEKIL
ncbi:MAG: redoxin domain-containing protein, partial [Alphaproteobacteria bacterium]|nr:redoxin domain-containing protein [Alphaproteobacteria bacterium]